MKKKILISNVGFGDAAPKVLQLLKERAEVIENINRKKFSAEDFIEHSIDDVEILIAGTEKIDQHILGHAKKLKLIARVGVGLDNVDLHTAFDKGIEITYTPDAPALSVPEFTLALILNLLKGVSVSDRALHQKNWVRPMGQSLSECHIGIIGAGKIGAKLIQLLLSLHPSIKISFYDPYVDFIPGTNKVSLEEIFSTCNLVSVHVPFSKENEKMIGRKLLFKMPKNSYIVNTSRGGILDEKALYDALKANLAGAAIDVFEKEPYQGALCELENCLLTAHIGSMNQQVRALMEEQVLEDIFNFLDNRSLLRSVHK